MALVCAVSRPLATDPVSVLSLQLDPYLVGPLAPGPRSLAALQARALIDKGRCTEADLAEIVRARRGLPSSDDLLARPYEASPLRTLGLFHRLLRGGRGGAGRRRRSGRRDPGVDRRHRAPASRPRGSGGATSRSRPPPAPRPNGSASWVRRSTSWRCTRRSATRSRSSSTPSAPRSAALNPSGGALPADPIMATGLMRIGAAATEVLGGGPGGPSATPRTARACSRTSCACWSGTRERPLCGRRHRPDPPCGGAARRHGRRPGP